MHMKCGLRVGCLANISLRLCLPVLAYAQHLCGGSGILLARSKVTPKYNSYLTANNASLTTNHTKNLQTKHSIQNYSETRLKP